MSDLDVLTANMKHLQEDVQGVRSDIKELTKALVEMVRLDSDVKNLMDWLNRLSGKVDGIEKDIAVLKTRSALNGKSVGLFDSLVSKGIFSLINIGIGAALLRLLGGG